MAKIKIIYDTNTSKIEVLVGKIKTDDVYAVFIHKDIENLYNFTLDLFTDSGVFIFKNSDVKKENNESIIFNKTMSYFDSKEVK